jgi:hypothetical protein
MVQATPRNENHPFVFCLDSNFLISLANAAGEENVLTIAAESSSSAAAWRWNVLYGFTGVKGIFIITRQTCRKLSRRRQARSLSEWKTR